VIGQTIAHYKIIEKLGEGGMGEVFLADDTKLERRVALKFLPASLTKNPEARQRLIREAKAASKLNHPNILTIHAVESVDDRDFIAMEYVDGHDLTEYLKSHPLTIEEKLALATQIAEGLGKAHSVSVIHRDIKPSNILVDQDGRPRLLDFGLATFEGAARLTQTGSTVGTAAYMSPEQASGRECDHRSDLFSLGVVLYEMIADRLPFQGAHNAALMYAIVNEEPQPVTRFVTSVPDELQRVISKLLAKHPAERYQSTADLVSDLRRLIRLSSSGHQQATAERKKMLAVLPFENLGPADDEYFADGITEEIISRLSSVKDIGVISRTSVMQYKGTKKAIRDIGGELGVDFILEGTVRWGKAAQGASRVRITPQLIRVNEDTHMWSDRYDRVIEDIFDVQSDIAEKVTEQLNVKLGDPERRAIEARPTQNLDAYHAFLRGGEYLRSNDYSVENHRLAIQMFERAVMLDPGFAQAHAYLSVAHSGMYFYGHDRSPERIQKAKSTVESALALNHLDPETPLANGFFRYRCLRDLKGAIAEFQRSIQLQPNHSLAIFMVAMIQRRLGQFVEAIGGAEVAIKLDPMRSQYPCEAGITCFIMRRFEQANTYFQRSISIAPDQYNAYTWSAMLQLFAYGNIGESRRMLEMMGERGREESIWEWYEQSLMERDLSRTLEHIQRVRGDVYEEQSWYFPKSLMIAEAHYLLGDPKDAEPEYRRAALHLESAVASDPQDPRKRLALAKTYVGLGRIEEAIQHAQTAVEVRPISEDAITVPLVMGVQAAIHAQAGDSNGALRIIEYLLSIPSWMSAGHLRVAPYWDKLRQHPEFERLITLPPKVF
jgi:non-specific serine/threonine protein kinase